MCRAQLWVRLPVCLSGCLSVGLSVCQSACAYVWMHCMHCMHCISMQCMHCMHSMNCINMYQCMHAFMHVCTLCISWYFHLYYYTFANMYLTLEICFYKPTNGPWPLTSDLRNMTAGKVVIDRIKEGFGVKVHHASRINFTSPGTQWLGALLWLVGCVFTTIRFHQHSNVVRCSTSTMSSPTNMCLETRG